MSEAERRRFLTSASLMLATPAACLAQAAARVYRIAELVWIPTGGRSTDFREGLSALGYVVGQNLVIETRSAEGQRERLHALVDELIRTRPDVIVTGVEVTTLAAMKATRTIPIVFRGVPDPVEKGLVTNLARPEANVTGLSFAIGEAFAGKWLQLLRQVAPKVTHVAALHGYERGDEDPMVQGLRKPAQASRVRLDTYLVTNTAQLDLAKASIARSGAQALIVPPIALSSMVRPDLLRFAADKRLPVIYFSERLVEQGGLMSYGPDVRAVSRRAASYVDKIFKGAKPADLPVEQPTEFNLVINLKTARSLGLEVPRELLVSASRLIE